ncbi:hypothetical protein HALO32_01466 [Halomonas lysinitropha]|uniref:Uncharacterized protein n=1 Tax=Halomonas lysinitropha TaxID=2607506 RepID=A0A5K1I668_9GAMM|nr:hypothetical protein HALO32_01466 [Halomonas lysinitropha]
MKQRHQSQVDSHVAVEDMTELVGNHSLELVAIQRLDSATGDPDGYIVKLVSCREGVDGRILQQVDQRDRHAGSNRHLFHHVEQPPLVSITGLKIEGPAAQGFGHHTASRPQLQVPNETPQAHHQNYRQCHPGEQRRLQGSLEGLAGQGATTIEQHHCQGHHQRGDQDQRR